MQDPDIFPAAAVGTFATHESAEAGIRELSLAGFDVRQLSVIGRGYHVDEQVTGFYNMGNRIRLWGSRGAFWGGLWSLFFSGVFVTVPLIGPVVALGYLGLIAVSVLEGALVVGGASAIAAVFYGIGIPRNSVLQYEAAITTDAYLVMAHDTPARVAQAKKILETAGASRVDVHDCLCPASANDAVACATESAP
jgi:hypothetical protein